MATLYKEEQHSQEYSIKGEFKNHINQNYNEELMDLYHSKHNLCGENMCEDAGGAVVGDTDYPSEEEYMEIYKENKKDIDAAFGGLIEINISTLNDK